MPGTSLHDAPQELTTFLDILVEDVRSLLDDELVAIVLHGSLATGSFYAPKSDIDLMIVVKRLSNEEEKTMYDLLRRHHEKRPYVGGIETTVIRKSDAEAPIHPVPFLVHFSETTTGPRSDPGGELPTDEDLLAHLMVAKERGTSLFGPPPHDLIGPLRWNDYLSSIRGDVDWILADENLLTTPAYGVLNLCRWAMMKHAAPERIVPSKEEAGLWGRSHLPASIRPVVDQALAAYRSTEWPRSTAERQMAGGPWDRASLLAFRDELGRLST